MSDQTVIPATAGHNAAKYGNGEALIIVRNAGTHDSRVLREARTLKSIGYRPEVIAVVSEDEPRTEATIDGTHITRLAPGSPLSWLRSRLRSGGEDERGDTIGADAPQASPATPEAGSLRALVVRIHRWLRTLDYYRRAIALVRRERPALLHCNDYNTMWVGVAARLLGGSTVVYDSHELWPDRNGRSEPRWWLIACESLFVRAAHRTITASPGYAEVMAKRYRIAPPGVIRNIPDSSMLSATGSRNGDSPAGDGRLALYVGALTTGRGLEISIMALNRLDDVRLRLVGPARPAYLEELVQLAEV